MNRYIKILLLISLSLSSLYSCSGKLWNTPNSSSSKKGLLNNDLMYEETAERWAKIHSKTSPVRGWEYVIEKLSKAGIDTKTLAEIYSDPKIPTWTPINFKVSPKESKDSYQGHINKTSIENASSFYKQNVTYFKKALTNYGVDPFIVLAILQVETKCGKNTGNEPVLYWLSRLVSTGFPPNLTYNLTQSKEKPIPSLKEFEERASWLEEEFTPHLVATIEISKKAGSSPFDIIGSKGGAIGMPQFLPGNVEKFGVDGDKNGSVNIYTAPDAILSVANFLKSHGWNENISTNKKYDVILEYNRSTAYADTVSSLSKELEKKLR